MITNSDTHTHTHTHTHSRYDSSGREILGASTATTHKRQTNMFPAGIRTRSSSHRVVTGLRPRGHWDVSAITILKFKANLVSYNS